MDISDINIKVDKEFFENYVVGGTVSTESHSSEFIWAMNSDKKTKLKKKPCKVYSKKIFNSDKLQVDKRFKSKINSKRFAQNGNMNSEYSYQ